MDDWQVYQAVEAELKDFKSQGFDVFVHKSRNGAIHSIDEPGEVTSINTATLYRILKRDRSYCKGCDNSELEGWCSGVLNVDLQRNIPNLDPERRDEYSAYRVAQILRAVPDTAGQQALKKWLLAYVTRWLTREDSRQISVFLVYLCVDALGCLSEAPVPTTEVPGAVRRFAEFVISRQISIGASEMRTDLDATDLALALSIAEYKSLAPGVLSVSLDLLNKAVTHEGLWTNRQPILRLGQGIAGCSAFEAALALLTPRRLPNPYSSLRGALVSHLQWLRDNRSPDTPWRPSDLYLREPKKETWFNCLAAQFLATLLERLDESMQAELRTKYRAKIVESRYKWDEMILGDKERDAVHGAFIGPVKGTANAQRLDRCTALLFGPPGTTKTTIAETVAKEISWPFVEVGVADFLRKGLDSVFGVAIEIFEDLLRLQNVVVLLDEVEGVFAERTEKESDLRQKFLTSALLPPLKRVKDRGRIILFIATNHVDAFDQAIRRPGRIDLIVGVGPPEEHQREVLLQKAVGLPDDIAKKLAGLLPDVTTIAEIMWLKKYISANPVTAGGHAPSELFAKWEERFHGRQQISDVGLREFNGERQTYSRLD